MIGLEIISQLVDSQNKLVGLVQRSGLLSVVSEHSLDI